MSDNASYAVGIDLGTTNSVLAYMSLEPADRAELRVLAIPQLSAPGMLEEKPQLPSFLYQPHAAELNPADLRLPWTEQPAALVGEIARHLGAKTPMRLVSSAKSWLCHTDLDCRQALLPVQAAAEVSRISPWQASVHYLQHLCAAWNAAHPTAPLEQQPLTITVPASFNPAARELTIAAAHELGLTQATLLEEPQAALYNWLVSCADWRTQVNVGDIILVVDVGGGTSDFSLIAVDETNGELALQRIAIGEHILLGGDNMDLALAYALKAKLEAAGHELAHWHVQALAQHCRDAKETLLTDTNLDEVAVVVPGRGARLIGDSLRTSLTRAEIQHLLLDGFFPELSIDQHPLSTPRDGLTTFSLPYAQDARITAHLAAFLSRQANAAHELSGFARPTAVLLNGGVFKAEIFTQRLLAVINRWLAADNAAPVRLLGNTELDLAVARGAAYYAYVRQGHGVSIRAGSAAAYYVGVAQAMPVVPGLALPLQALCIAPFGMQEGDTADLPPYEFGLVVGEPVCFRFFASTTRRTDSVGTLLQNIATLGLEELGKIEVTLPLGERCAGVVVPVNLAARYTAMGTLQLEAIALNSEERWQVALNVKPLH